MQTVLSNALIVTAGESFHGYVVIDAPMIAAVGRGNLPEGFASQYQVVDLQGKILMPGAIDTHVHFREPGLTHKSTIASESAAALAGGVTSFLEMPNTKPPTVSIAAWEEKMTLGEKTSVANYAFFIGATNDNIAEILGADFSRIPGIKLFLGSSTGNMLVESDEALNHLFSSFKGVIAVHAEDEATIHAAADAIRCEYPEGNAPVALHSRMRSREACLKASQKAVELARKHNARLHICHVSTADELSLLTSGQLDTKRITAETCPHYLLFNEAMLAGAEGWRYKCNPAIKSSEDAKALLKALADKRIDTVATDHAPHTQSEKQGSLFEAASGMPGIKFMLPAMVSLAMDDDNELTLCDVARLTATNPARLYGISKRGEIRPGFYADLVVIEPADYVVADADSISHLPGDANPPGCRWTPYTGVHLKARVHSTYLNGHEVFANGVVAAHPSLSMPLKFQNQQ